MGNGNGGTVNNVGGNQYNAGRDIIINNSDGSPKPQTITCVWQWYNSGGGAYDPELHLSDDAKDLAVVIQVSGKIVKEVYDYLRAKGMYADIVVLSNLADPTTAIQKLSTNSDSEWMQLANSYTTLLTYDPVPRRKIHLFINAPAALSYMLGTRAGYNQHPQCVYSLDFDAEPKSYALVGQFRPPQR